MRKLLLDKKGLSLAELVICVVVLSLVFSIMGSILYQTTINFDRVSTQWTIQQEIKFIMDALLWDSASGSLSTSNCLEIYYEDMEVAKTAHVFTSCSDLGSFTESADGKLTFTKEDTDCIYIFNYNERFYILNRGQKTAEPYVKFEETALKVKFTVGTNVFAEDQPQGFSTDSPGKPYWTDEGETIYRNYVPDSLTVKIESSDTYKPAQYCMESSYSLKNMQGKKINIKDGYISSTYAAGWTAELDSSIQPYYEDYYQYSPSSYENLNKAGNIIKYTSSSAGFGQAAEAGDSSFDVQAGCATRWLMIGERFNEPVISNIHDFRDNVLKGNAIGEFIIEKYYDWSPAVIELASKYEFVETSLRWFVVHFAMLLE